LPFESPRRCNVLLKIPEREKRRKAMYGMTKIATMRSIDNELFFCCFFAFPRGFGEAFLAGDLLEDIGVVDKSLA
jgi:hypothetical protein